MSQIPITDIVPRTQVMATLNQTVFSSATWTANAASDVVVYVTPAGDAPDDATQILSYPSQYSVAFIGDQLEVEVTLVTPSALGDIVTIIRNTPADRLNLYSNTNFLPSMLNNDFGILTLVDQQAQLVNQYIGPRYNYSAQINTNVVGSTRDTILPLLLPNETWQMNAAGTGIEAVTISQGSGTITQIDTGFGLTGGPITSTGTISLGAMNANTFWGNITGGSAVPTMVATTYFLKSANNLSDLTNVPAAQSNIGLAIGVNVQAYSANLTSIGALAGTANSIPYFSALNTYAAMTPVASAVLITSAGSVPSLSTTLPLAVQSNITQLGAQTVALNMNSHQINNVTTPSNPQDAATKAYVDTLTGAYLPLVGGTMAGQIDMGNHKIVNMTDPSSAQDAVTVNYLSTQLALKLSLSGGTMTGAINMGSHFITSLLDPVNPQDAATKNYVDTVAVGLNVQAACYAASTTALTVTYSNGASGIGATLTNAGAQATFAIDGVSPAVNSRILIKDQASTLQNGIYTVTNVGSGASNWILTRSTDYDQPSEIQPGDLVVINNGTVNAGTSFIETASVAAVGTDPILFSQFTFSATSVLLKANNLSDVANVTTSFNNISPLTTKGDLIGFSTQNIRVAVGGTNTQVLQVDSTAAAGFSWSTATYPKTTTANQILYSSATNTVVGLATIAGGILVTDASGVPSMLTNPGVAGKILQSANAAIPTWSTPTYPSVSGTLGKLLISDGTNNVYSTSTFPTSAGATANKLLLSDGTNYILSTPTFPNAAPAAGKIMIGDGTNWIASTPTYPNASVTTRKLIVSDGTNFIATTETWAVPGTSGNQLTSDGTNWISSAPTASGVVSSGLINQLAWYAATGTTVSGLATSASGVLVTSAGSVPSISTTLPANIAMTTPLITAGIKDSNGNVMLGFSPQAAAVNYISILNNTAGNQPALFVSGSDTNINFQLSAKGSGGVLLYGDATAIYSSASLPMMTFLPVASSVNYLTTQNAATGSPVYVAVLGTDSNIKLYLNGKGTGGANIQGTSTNDDADAGYVGRFVSSVIASGSAVSILNNTAKNMTSISLTAGDWDVVGNLQIQSSAQTLTTAAVWISTTSATIPDASLYGIVQNAAALMIAVTPPIPSVRISIAATTTVYISGYALFTGGTASMSGGIYARRVR